MFLPVRVAWFRVHRGGFCLVHAGCLSAWRRRCQGKGVGKRLPVDETRRVSDRVFPTVLATATLTTEIIAFGAKINRTNTARRGRTCKKRAIVRSEVATPTFSPRKRWLPEPYQHVTFLWVHQGLTFSAFSWTLCVIINTRLINHGFCVCIVFGLSARPVRVCVCVQTLYRVMHN